MTTPERLKTIQERYTGTATPRNTYEIRADDLAWLINEVELRSARVDPPAAPKCVLCSHAMRVDENGFCLDTVPFFSEYNPNDAVRCGCRCASSDRYDVDEADKALAQQIEDFLLMPHGVELKALLPRLQTRILAALAQARKEGARQGRLEGLREADHLSAMAGAIRERIKILESASKQER